MLKLLTYLNAIVIFITLNDGKTFDRGPTNDNSSKYEAPWQNLLLPYPTKYKNHEKSLIATVAPVEKTNQEAFDKSNTTDWSGLWFPSPQNYRNNVELEADTATRKGKPNEYESDKLNTKDWPGLWFPYPENYHADMIAKGIDVKKFECDNGKYNIGVDFDPQNARHSFNYLCIGNRTEYAPNLNTSALLKEYVIPAAYEPPVKCIEERIEYTELIPTFGSYRPLAPKFGTYNYLPPQRWLKSLFDGAIVFMYHPCASPGQIKQLQNTIRGCLYRHIITPSQVLTPEYPLALLAWGKRLQMSVVDETIVVTFIKDNAKMGFRGKKENLKMSSNLYDAGILHEAHLVTDDQDKEICGYIEMR